MWSHGCINCGAIGPGHSSSHTSFVPLFLWPCSPFGLYCSLPYCSAMGMLSLAHVYKELCSNPLIQTSVTHFNFSPICGIQSFSASSVQLLPASPFDNEVEISGQKGPAAKPVIIDGHEEWEVEKILSSCWHYHKLQYLVRWKNNIPDEDTWEPVVNLKGSQNLSRNIMTCTCMQSGHSMIMITRCLLS